MQITTRFTKYNEIKRKLIEESRGKNSPNYDKKQLFFTVYNYRISTGPLN